MIAALVLASVAALLALSLPRLLPRSRGTRRARPAHADADLADAPDAVHAEPVSAPPCVQADTGPGPYPESLTAELDPWDEEYLAFLADALWPEDEYLDMEHTLDFDGEGETGPGKYH
ncbi:hypothetical protein [Actinomadura rugatobispora]|uniref:Uncharacterized protein n=1 Tax=Actinomadura rugatobispora TaxID=1994 RepID=A0ABW1A1U5_9ACTN|nr:hypothetical protein GCM10010200_007380 [Actinomadura rugatobispora]